MFDNEKNKKISQEFLIQNTLSNSHNMNPSSPRIYYRIYCTGTKSKMKLKFFLVQIIYRWLI